MKAIHLSKTEKGRKQALTVVSALLLSLLYFAIFSFSEQDGETSGGLSLSISRACAEVLDFISGRNWTDSYRESLALYFEHPIRKLAHFTEYACMGVLYFGIWGPWKQLRPFPKRMILLTTFLIALSASFDEIHQLFVPDRNGTPADVLLDTCGGLCGLLVIYGLTMLHIKHGEKKARK